MQTRQYDIVLTDIQLHLRQFRSPKSFARQIEKSIRSELPGRVQVNEKAVIDQNAFSVELPIDVQKQIEEAKQKGMKIRFVMPKDGIPIRIGKDVSEFITAQEKRNTV